MKRSLALVLILSFFCPSMASAQGRTVTREKLLTWIKQNVDAETIAGGFSSFQVSKVDLESAGLLENDAIILAQLYKNLCSASVDCLRHILNGAYVQVSQDNGWYYNFFRSPFFHSYKRSACHESSAPLYAINLGKKLSSVLTGKNSKMNSWFQFERFAWQPRTRIKDCVGHGLSWIKYKISRRNVGPLGESPFTESYPMTIDFNDHGSQ